MDGDRRGVSRVPSTVALVVVAILVLAACGGSEETAALSPSATPVTVNGTTLPVPAVSGTIAFARSSAARSADIYVVNADGTGLQQLTDGPGKEDHPSWSPDGTRIAYDIGEDFPDQRADSSVWVMNADGSGKVELAKGDYPHWSPDGEQIVFTRFLAAGRTEIRVMNADGSDARTAVRATRLIGGEGRDTSWLSDERILCANGDLDLFALTLDGRRCVPLTRGGGVWGCAASPDGKAVAYYAFNRDRIEIVSSQRGGADVLLKRVSDYVRDFKAGLAWTADGKALAVSSGGSESNGSPIFVVNADGSGLSAVPGVEWAYDPTWRPQ